MEGDVLRKVWPSEGDGVDVHPDLKGARSPSLRVPLLLPLLLCSVYVFLGRETALGSLLGGFHPTPLRKSIPLFCRGDGSVSLPLPFPLPHPLVCCNAAEVQGSFFIHRPVCTVKGGGAGEGSNGASLGKVTLFPLVLNR